MTAAPPTYPDMPPPATFIPSTEAVEAAAAALYAANGGSEEWNSLPPVSKLNARTLAMTMLNKAGPALLTTALAHVTANYKQYGFTKELADELVFAQHAHALEGMLDLSEVGIPFPDDEPVAVSQETPDQPVT